MAGAFATNAKSQIELRQFPSEPLGKSPAYLPTRELVTLWPWFLSLYSETEQGHRSQHPRDRCKRRASAPEKLAGML